MATASTREKQENRLMCLKCNVVKFVNEISLADTDRVQFAQQGLISLSGKEGLTRILRFKHGNAVSLQFTSSNPKGRSCKMVHWDTRHPPVSDSGVFFSQDRDSTVLEFSVSGDTVTLHRQLPLEPLQKAIEDYSQCQVKTVQLVGYEKGYLLFNINGDTLSAAEIMNNVCMPCSWVPLPTPNTNTSESMSCFCIAADVIVVLDLQAQLLFVYNLCDGELVCQIDLEPAGFSNHTVQGENKPKPLSWTVSSSLSKLLWLDSRDTIFSLDIDLYIRSKPNAIKLSERAQGSKGRKATAHTMHTCRQGGFSWRQTLINIHHQQIGASTNIPWSHQKLATSSSKQSASNISKISACGFRGKQQRGREKGKVDNYLKCIRLPEGNLLQVGYAVSQISCSGSVVTMVMVSPSDVHERAVCMVDLKSQQVYFHSLPKDHFPILSPCGSIPMMVINPGGLLLLLPASCVDQEDIVSKLMVHSSAQTTDSLCQLNGWGRTTVPLHALELGLRQHQLDTVTLFIGSKENLFSGQSNLTDTSPHQRTTPGSENTHQATLAEILPALDLFLKVINGDLVDISPPREFRLRLLTQMLEFLHELLKDGSVRLSQLGGVEREVAEKVDLDKALEVVMGYIAQLRDAMETDELREKRFLRALTMKRTGSTSTDKESVDTISMDSVDACLPTLDVCSEEDIEKACQANDMPTLQARLLSMEEEVRAQWGQVVRVGLQRAWSHVQRRDLSAAQSIITNLGLDVAKTVWTLAQFTVDRGLQQYIVEELRSAHTLSSDDVDLVNYMHRLYSLYPATSLSHCMNNAQQHGLVWSSENPIASHLRSVQTNVASQAKDIKCDPTSHSTHKSAEGPYCVTALHWLRQMDAEMKEAVLLDAAALRGESMEESNFSPQLLWRYWLSRNQPPRAIQALEVAMAREWGMLGSLLEVYLQDLSLSSSFVQFSIKTHLLRKRVYRWEILKSLNLSLEERMRVMKGVLHTPHPLQGYGHKVVLEFHHQFADYCARYGFIVPLWIYCSLHNVDVDSLMDLECGTEVSWFKPFVLLHSAVNQPNNCSRMFAGSLSMASIHWKPDDWSLARLLTEGHVTTAAATLAYLPETVNVIQVGGQETQYGVDSEMLHQGLQRFPKLLSALLPPDADTSRFDINVYQLLRDNAPLDSRRLFGWQSTNATASEDGMKVLPFFSHVDLVGRFAHTAKLSFTYYLKHGRPSYAFLSFLAENLQHKTSTLSSKSVQAACGMALWLSVKNFHNPQISSACVAFVEMLGRDSIVLRTYIHAGETILAHKSRSLTGPVDKRKEQTRAAEQEIVSLLQSCLGNRHRHGRRLLSAVEDAISDEVAKEGLSSTSVEAALKWNLAMLLCHHLHLPLSSRFLELCAHDDRWLPFVWFAQLHQFPKVQLQQIIHQFPSRQLRDHLHYIITNASANTVTSATISSDGKQGSGGVSADGNRNVRSSLYSKIGVQASTEPGTVSSEEEEEEDSAGQDNARILRSPSTHASEDDIEVTEESTASDVFRVIFSAMATTEPWKSLLMHSVVLRNPLFAELAACCNAPMVSSMCAWLVAMLAPNEHARFVEHHGKRAWRWSDSHLEKLMEVYLHCHAENTLTAAFFIFQPTSPLLSFLQFIKECVSWRNYEGCKIPLDNFKDAMAAISPTPSKAGSYKDKGQSKGEQSCDSTQVIGDRDWLERMAYKVVKHELIHCESVYDAVHMLRLLAEENIALVFSFDVLDFNHLHKMLAVLHKHQVTSVHLPHLFSSSTDRQAYLQECQTALQTLMTRGLYEDAYIFGQYAGLDLSAAVLRQLASEKHQLKTSGVWKSPVIRRRYWKQSASQCARFHLPSSTVADFFQKESEEQESLREKSALFKLALTHLRVQHDRQGKSIKTELKDHIFTSMWRYRIQDRVLQRHTMEAKKEAADLFSDTEETDTQSRMSSSRQELLHTAVLPKPKVDPANELNSEEAVQLEGMMGDLLAEGHISECCELARLLGGQSSDLIIILTCIGLSTGEVTMSTMDAASRLLLTTSERRPSLTSLTSFARTSSSISLASAAPNWDFLPASQEEIIFTMEQLLSRCQKCRPCCLRIISVYKIACLTGRSYKDIVMGEEFCVLRELLKTDFPHRYTLAAQFLSTSTLSDSEVASFLVEEIVKSLRIYMGGKDGFEGGSRRSGSSELIFRPTEGGEVFSQLVSLCADPAILGNKLLNALATMADGAPDPSQAVLSMETELLIMGHECHTAACNMEGISDVLRAARVCAQCLAAANQYHLMMRLLTGIGRYSEMTYIFDFLQQHHQFEMLLRKGIDKDDKLKTAILDYLKRFHSEDKDTYSMVALNFSMYREIAHMLDESGHRYLGALKDKALDNIKETQDTLKKCIQYFGDAAESYAKDKCFMNAQKCLKWARLVNLQLHLLGSGVKVVNLTADEIKTFVASHPKFLEAFVVTEAYAKTVDWSESLYSQVLLSGDMRYLQDFRTYLKLTPALIESTLYKLRHSPGKLTSCASQVKRLLKLCPDVWLQYQIAQDLGLQDVVKDLLRNDTSSSYIKDLIGAQ